MKSHEFNDLKLQSNEKQQTITIKNGRKEKTYPFSSIIGWRYNLDFKGRLECFSPTGVKLQNVYLKTLYRLKTIGN
ncbi:hypothetical protein ACKVM9_003822 [Pantoea agglomerans]|uniref:hypothetical protein n=1 Tax=Enterobacter agglomerans TaxID=549 RepID=UPI000E217759|nr:hypothetical protein H0Z11_07670 [Pantoea agglomerans]